MSQIWKDWEPYMQLMTRKGKGLMSDCPNIQKNLPNLKMKIIVWNVRGASNSAFVPHAWDVVRLNKPSIFIIFEAKADECRARQVTRLLGFDDFKAIPPHGLKDGIWVMWKKSIELVSWSEVSPYYFHSLFKFSPKHPEVLLTGMHAPCTAKERHEIWKNMEQNLPPDQTPWMVVGDLNEVRNQNEKSGGRAFRSSQCKALLPCRLRV